MFRVMPRRISKLFLEVLDDSRRRVFEELHRLPRGGVLGGGTSLALQIGHRRSYDFDLFYTKKVGSNWLRDIHQCFSKKLIRPIVRTDTELTVILAPDMKLTLLHYPFPHLHPYRRVGHITLFHLRDLASSKAYTIGRRGAWRDYVDLFFLLRDHLSLQTIIRDSERRFGGQFDAKLFLQQLTYFDDIIDRTVEFTGTKIASQTIEGFFCAAVRKFLDQTIRQKHKRESRLF